MLDESYIEEIINKHSGIRIKEKDKYGEVLTPKKLIEEMLDTLPLQVWTNPHLIWLDPTSGIGNFMMVVYLRLMKGLQTWEPNDHLRSSHILQNMLHFIEMNEENVEKSKEIFGPEANILKDDILSSIAFSKQFDIIVGNPPFQEDCHSKKRVGGKNKLYEKIIAKCIKILNPDGYLLLLTPDNFFSGTSKTCSDIITNHSVITICFQKSLQHYFPKIQQYVCYFLMKKSNQLINENTNFKTCIVGNDGTTFPCTLSNRPVNPVRNWNQETEINIQVYVKHIKNNAVYNRGKKLSEYSSDTSCNTEYEIIFKPLHKLVTTRKELAIGIGVPKIVVFLISVKLELETDYEGKYGVGPNTLYFPVKNETEGKVLEHFLKGDVYKNLLYAVKTNRQFLKIPFLEHLNIEKIIMDKYNIT